MEEKVKALHERYVDMCVMCTKIDCDKCFLNVVIEELEEIIISEK